LKLKQGRTKHLLRRLLERSIPKSIVDRPKHGFEAPIGSWLRGPLAPMMNELLLDGRMRQRGIFDQKVVERAWRQHRDGVRDHRHRLWSLMMLELWFREFVDGQARRSRSRDLLQNEPIQLVTPNQKSQLPITHWKEAT
jgi:asparagine synthetase B (glutamine-hydrolysing)